MQKVVSTIVLLLFLALCVLALNNKISPKIGVSGNSIIHREDSIVQRNISLKTTLNQILENDQKYRILYDSILGNTGICPNYLWDTINKIDSENLLEVVKIMNRYGWVSVNIVGENGEEAIFLVIQHAALRTQLSALPLLTIAVLNHDAPKEHLIFLLDRILTKLISRQLFGTQYYFDSQNKKVLYPVLFQNRQ